MRANSCRLLILTLATVSTCVLPPQAFAWAGKGHRAICQIAWRELSPSDRQKIEEILAGEDRKFRTFPAACTWADDEKHTPGTEQNQRRADHYVNVPRDLVSIKRATCNSAPTCLFSAIEFDTRALEPGSGKNPAEALKFLAHWIGDLHQPLHVSYEDDAGGNDIGTPQGFECASLHLLWDECLPADLMKTMAVRSATAMGDRLHRQITTEQRNRWRTGTPTEWAAESYDLVRRPETRYCTLDGPKGKCCYSATQCEHRGKRRITAKLNKTYSADHQAVVGEQMQKAGVRLAMVLQTLLARH